MDAGGKSQGGKRDVFKFVVKMKRAFYPPNENPNPAKSLRLNTRSKHNLKPQQTLNGKGAN